MNHQSNTRYHTTSFTPPALDRVCKALGRAWKKSGPFSSTSAVRGVIGQASSEYEGERGRSDELTRFLFNEGVLLTVTGNKDRIVYDAVRAETVLNACDAKIATPSISGEERRRRARELEDERKGGRKDDQTASDPESQISSIPPHSEEPQSPLSEEASSSDRNEPEQPEATQVGIFEGREIGDAFYTEFEKVCAAFCERVPKPATFSLWLTPLEEDVWTTLLASAQEIDGELRVGIPRSKDGRLGLRGTGVRHYGDHDYELVFARFIDSGILECIGENSTGNLPYRFVIPPEKFFVQKIPTRGIESLPTKIVEHVRALQRRAVDARGEWRPMAAEVESVLDLEPDDIGYRRADGRICVRPTSWRIPRLEGLLLGDYIPPANQCCLLSLFYVLSSKEDPTRGCLVPYPNFEPHRVYDRLTAPRIAATLYSPTGDPEMSLGLSLGGFPWSEHGRVYSPYNNEGELVDAFTHPEELRQLSDKALQHFESVIDDLERHLPHWKARLRREYESREAEKELRRKRAEERRTVTSQLTAKRSELEALQAELKALEERERMLSESE